jgi:hypothetical protein
VKRTINKTAFKVHIFVVLSFHSHDLLMYMQARPLPRGAARLVASKVIDHGHPAQQALVVQRKMLAGFSPLNSTS